MGPGYFNVQNNCHKKAQNNKLMNDNLPSGIAQLEITSTQKE